MGVFNPWLRCLVEVFMIMVWCENCKDVLVKLHSLAAYIAVTYFLSA